MEMNTYGKMRMHLKILKLFQKKRIIDPYQVELQVSNIHNKVNHGWKEPKTWTISKIRKELSKKVVILR